MDQLIIALREDADLLEDMPIPPDIVDRIRRAAELLADREYYPENEDPPEDLLRLVQKLDSCVTAENYVKPAEDTRIIPVKMLQDARNALWLLMQKAK